MYRVRIYGDQVLREEGRTVPADKIESMRAVAEEMYHTMYSSEGIGLAAQQVGITDRIVVIDTKQSPDEKMVLINPTITAVSTEESVMEEGCLSFPGVRADIKRPVEIDIEYYDLDGNIQKKHFDDLLARVAQHEIDHINGILFIDRMSPVSRMMLRKKLARLKASHKDPVS